jgi:hypothetical protein
LAKVSLSARSADETGNNRAIARQAAAFARRVLDISAQIA